MFSSILDIPCSWSIQQLQSHGSFSTIELYHKDLSFLVELNTWTALFYSIVHLCKSNMLHTVYIILIWHATRMTILFPCTLPDPVHQGNIFFAVLLLFIFFSKAFYLLKKKKTMLYTILQLQLYNKQNSATYLQKWSQVCFNILLTSRFTCPWIAPKCLHKHHKMR